MKDFELFIRGFEIGLISTVRGKLKEELNRDSNYERISGICMALAIVDTEIEAGLKTLHEMFPETESK